MWRELISVCVRGGDGKQTEKAADKNPKKLTDTALLRQWLGDVGGSIFIGESTLKSVKFSKDNDRLTVVLKKKKPKKSSPAAT